MTPLRILFTNNTLADRAGSELYVRDVAKALLERGHRPIAFSTKLGAVADELRAATIPVIDHFEQLGAPPDIIHAHHHIDTAMALCALPDTPAVSICHGWIPWEEYPARFARIHRYLAVDEVCYDRLVSECGFAPQDVEILPNFVDLTRFTPRDALPPTPRRALLFANSARQDGYAGIVAEACRHAGIALDVVGAAVGRPIAEPATILGQYDLVFAKARAALEAMAVGCAVILCDEAGVGPLVTKDTFPELRRLNFGIRTLRRPHSVDHMTTQIAKYDPADAEAIRTVVRTTAGMDAVVDRLLEVYRDAIATHATLPVSRARELELLGAYLRWLAPQTVDIARLNDSLTAAVAAYERERGHREAERAERDALRSQVHELGLVLAAERGRPPP
jgi:hypothetical protein